ncbi:nucleotide pyrophosphohydrolase [Rhabdobacter roseus]|uniref:NTP pyrophosphatase (Non-canonical NTP hydrolase) n=1 Tax=Rhabdobacter roseus TaxID=1655419 RepID=A0A840U3J4_9BACT|nr:nucleotide pyrophosphohydrolase [Rhabdobacter roseus]MBB5286409.1 NTP pyrophosphatase (non-canonical NTP hydrolase) [Rhabdobacter roseus]
MKTEIEAIIEKIKAFRDERDWQQFHDPKNLAICLTIESSELLQAFLWKNADGADVEKIKEELADVLYSALLIADHYNLNIKDIIEAKLKRNAQKYPVEKAKGSNKKYDDL